MTWLPRRVHGMFRARPSLVAVVSVTVLNLAGCAQLSGFESDTMGANDQVGEILLRNVHLEAPAGGEYGPGQNGVLRLALFNGSGRDDRLVAVRSAVAGQARIRWDQDCDGVFEAVGGMPVLAGASVPRSRAYYVELIGFQRVVYAGTTVPVTLTFEHAGEGTVDALVEASGDGDREAPLTCGAGGPAPAR